MKAVISLLYKYKYIIHTFLSSLESEHIHHTSGFKDNHSSTPSPLPPFTMFSGSCLTVLLISDHSPILLYTTDNFSYRHFKFKIFDTDNFRQLYFKSLTILTTDNRIFSYWHFLPLLDACISNHWQIYFLPLTLTIESPITNSCTIDNWHFYHLWLYFLPLRILSLMITLLKTDNSEQWQLHFLSSTIILLTTDNCTSYNYQL